MLWENIFYLYCALSFQVIKSYTEHILIIVPTAVLLLYRVNQSAAVPLSCRMDQVKGVLTLQGEALAQAVSDFTWSGRAWTNMRTLSRGSSYLLICLFYRT